MSIPVSQWILWYKKAELPKYVELILNDPKAENLLTLRHLKTKQDFKKKKKEKRTDFKLWPVQFKTLCTRFSFTPKEHL